MGRCGCESATECGCTMSGSDCIGVSGSGASADPYVPSILISGDPGNVAECRDDGLYVVPRDVAFHKRTAGNLNLNNSGSWANVNTATDLTLTNVTAGDIVEVGLSALSDNEAVNLFLDVASIVSAAPVNYWAGTGAAGDEGIQAWLGLTGVITLHGGSVMKAIVAGDLSAGSLTLRLRYRTSAAVAKTLQADTANPLQWFAKNHGPGI